jgi:hypothetical protein
MFLEKNNLPYKNVTDRQTKYLDLVNVSFFSSLPRPGFSGRFPVVGAEEAHSP